MAKTDPISSTEKLLDLIRKKGDKPPILPKDSRPKSRPSLRMTLSNPFSFKKRNSIGVSIGYSDINLVQVVHNSDKSQNLVKYERVSIPPDLKPDNPKFPVFLKKTLNNFCGAEKNIEVWSSISSERVEMRYLKIPKVPRRQLANTVYWAFKKEVAFDEQNDIFDFDLIGEIVESGTKRLAAMAYTAPKQDVYRWKNLFARSGYPLSGITIVPFLIQNLLRTRWIESETKSVCSLYIGRDWSRIDVFSKGNIILSRGIKAGIRSMIESVHQHITGDTDALTMESPEAEEFPAPPEQIEENLMEMDEARSIFFQFISDKAPSFEPSGSVAEEDIFSMISPALERLVRQVERTLEHFALNFSSDEVGKIYISGPLNAQQQILRFIGEQLGLSVDVFDPLAVGAMQSGNISIPESAAEREAYLPAVGMALSNNSLTPNFIYTYKDKNRSTKIRRINNAVLASLAAVMVFCIGIYVWQGLLIDQKATHIRQLQRQVQGSGPLLDKTIIQMMLSKVNNKTENLKNTSQKLKAMAIIGEIIQLTPPSIKLFSITGNLIQEPKKAEKKKKQLVLDGMVMTRRSSFDSTLAAYLLKLKESKLVTNPAIDKRSVEIFETQEVLRFVVNMETV